MKIKYYINNKTKYFNLILNSIRIKIIYIYKIFGEMLIN